MPRIVAMDVINTLLLLAGAAVIAVATRRPMRWTDIVSACALVLMAACMFYEAARIFGWIDIEAPMLRPYHVPALVFAMGVAIFERHVRAIWQIQWTNAELQRRVEEKVREIEVFHAQQGKRMREEALLADRQRILADMHDGLGASLIGLLRYAQAGAPQARELERRVAEALQELRIAVDALEPADGDLGVVLGKLRYRLEPLLASTGVQFLWDVGELPQVETLEPTAVFAIQRIVLEAVSNAIQHAAPRQIRITARAMGGQAISITVEDDGQGFDPGQALAGHGLANLHRRAGGIGASLKIESTAGRGSTVTLLVPRQLPAKAPVADPMVPAASAA
jgi:signal transduction histidine kinase